MLWKAYIWEGKFYDMRYTFALAMPVNAKIGVTFVAQENTRVDSITMLAKVRKL